MVAVSAELRLDQVPVPADIAGAVNERECSRHNHRVLCGAYFRRYTMVVSVSAGFGVGSVDRRSRGRARARVLWLTERHTLACSTREPAHRVLKVAPKHQQMQRRDDQDDLTIAHFLDLDGV